MPDHRVENGVARMARMLAGHESHDVWCQSRVEVPELHLGAQSNLFHGDRISGADVRKPVVRLVQQGKYRHAAYVSHTGRPTVCPDGNLGDTTYAWPAVQRTQSVEDGGANHACVLYG